MNSESKELVEDELQKLPLWPDHDKLEEMILLSEEKFSFRSIMNGIRLLVDPDRERNLYGSNEICTTVGQEGDYDSLLGYLRVAPMTNLERLSQPLTDFEVKERYAYFNTPEKLGDGASPMARPIYELKEKYEELKDIDGPYVQGRRARIEDVFAWKASGELRRYLREQEMGIFVFSDMGVAGQKDSDPGLLGEEFEKQRYWFR